MECRLTHLGLAPDGWRHANLATWGETVIVGNEGSMLEGMLVDQGRKGWAWEVRDQSGATLVKGKTKVRQEAKYQRDRALFQILATGWTASGSKPPRDGISDRVR